MSNSTYAIEERIALFIHHYLLNNMNVALAYKTVFPNNSDTQARKNGSKFLLKPKVQAELYAQQKKLREKLSYEKDLVLNELITMFEDTKKGNVGERKVALDALKLYVDITGLKAPTRQENVNLNIDTDPLTINFIRAENVPNEDLGHTGEQEAGGSIEDIV